MDWIFLLPEILDMHLKYIAHNIIKHEEACGFLDSTCVGDPVVDEIENGCNYFVHALDVLNLRVESGKDEENPCHIVIAVGLFLLLPADLSQLLGPRDQFVLLFAGVAEERDGEGWGCGGEEVELGLRAAGVFLYLLPELVVIFILFPMRMRFIHHKGTISILFGIQVLLDKICVYFLVEIDLGYPLFFIFREIAKH